MKYCPHCNAPIHKHTRLCPDCGRPLHGSGSREQTGSSNSQKNSAGRKGCAVLVIVLVAFIFIVLTVFRFIIGTVKEQSRRHERRGDDEQSYSENVPEIITTFTIPTPWDPDSPPTATTPVQEPTTSVSVQQYDITKNPFGETVLTVDLLFSNEGDTPVSFFTKYRAQAFQNGVECRVTFADAESAQKETLNVQPGSSLTVPQSFVLNDDSEISFVVSNFGFDTSVVLEQTLTVAE